MEKKSPFAFWRFAAIPLLPLPLPHAV